MAILPSPDRLDLQAASFREIERQLARMLENVPDEEALDMLSICLACVLQSLATRHGVAFVRGMLEAYLTEVEGELLRPFGSTLH